MYINKYIYINICMYRIQRYTVLPYIKHPDMPLSIPGMAMVGAGRFFNYLTSKNHWHVEKICLPLHFHFFQAPIIKEINNGRFLRLYFQKALCQ